MLINEQDWQKQFAGSYQGETRFLAPMAEHTRLAIGGRADVLVRPDDPLSLRNLIVGCRKNNLPYVTLGSGTNMLVRDGGIEGAVISLKSFDRIELLREDDDRAELFVEAGVSLQKLVNLCAERGYSGIEGLTGIPGTAGGAVVGNAGSYGCEMKDTVESVAIMDAHGKLDRFRAEGLGFTYRGSEIGPSDVVLSANLMLKKADRETVASKTDAFLTEKKTAQPVSERSAGCVFKNPAEDAAGRLIDRAGCKGMRVGGVEVSRIHANFFVNKGGGSSADYMALMDKVSALVREKFGVLLEPEVRIIGRGSA